MAKLNNIEMKAIKNFKDHDGCSIAQAAVYVDGKKAGFWSQDAWGGPDTYDDCYDMIRKSAEQFKEGYPKTDCYYDIIDDPDVFMGYLLTLSRDEKAFKKQKKCGYQTMLVVTDGYHVSQMSFADKLTMQDVTEKYQKDLEDMKKGMFGNVKPAVKLYASEDDFNVTVDALHPAPEWMVGK